MENKNYVLILEEEFNSLVKVIFSLKQQIKQTDLLIDYLKKNSEVVAR